MDYFRYCFWDSPRINAAGRIEHGKIAVDILTAANQETAAKLAEQIESLNSKKEGLIKKLQKRR